MSGAPKPEDDQSNPTRDVRTAPHTPPSAEAASEAKQPTQGAPNPPERTQQVVGLCDTAIRKTLLKIKNSIAFIDRHNAFITAVATIAIAILTGYYVTYAKRQWIAMHDQLEEMRSSSLQTDKMIAVAAAQAEASKISAEVAQQTLIASQRAWVGPVNAKVDGAVEADKPVNVVISVRNTGREPAKNFFWGTNGMITTPDEDTSGALGEKIMIYLQRCLATPSKERTQVIYPSTGFGSGFDFTITFPKQDIDADVTSGNKMLIVQGCLVYDTFGKTKHSAFCYFFKSGTTKPDHLNICTGGTDAD